MAPKYLKKPTAATPQAIKPSLDVSSIVKDVIDTIRKDGDKAVRIYSERFDKWTPESFKLSPEQIQEAISAVPDQTINDIKQVQQNVRRFAEAQKDALKDIEIEIQPGVFLGHTNKPIETVGTCVFYLYRAFEN